MLSVHKTTVFFFKSTSKHEKQQKGTGTGRQFVLTAQTKTMERDWHWTSISAIFNLVPRARDLQEKNRELWDNPEPEPRNPGFFATFLSVSTTNQIHPDSWIIPELSILPPKITGSGYEIAPSLASLSATKFSLQIYMELTDHA